MTVITLRRKYLAVLAAQSPWPGVRTSTAAQAEALTLLAVSQHRLTTALGISSSAMLRGQALEAAAA